MKIRRILLPVVAAISLIAVPTASASHAVDGTDVNGTNHVVHVAWADNRDVSPCDLDPEPGPASNNTGNRNENIYADKLVVTP